MTDTNILLACILVVCTSGFMCVLYELTRKP